MISWREHQYTLREAALAVQMPLKTLRNWIDRDEVTLEGLRDDDGVWRLMSFEEVVRLRMARVMNVQGIKIAEAWRLSEAILSGFFENLNEGDTALTIARLTHVSLPDPYDSEGLVSANFRLAWISDDLKAGILIPDIHIVINIKQTLAYLTQQLDEDFQEPNQSKD